MKTLGLIGGTSWISTIDYYTLLNRLVGERLGGAASAKLLLYSVNFEEYKGRVLAGAWSEVAVEWTAIARMLEHAGAEGLMFCANTPHAMADEIQAAVGIPLIHIAEATARAIGEKGLKKVGLLGTKATMELPFYRERLARHGIEVVIPDETERVFINNSIFNELTNGIFRDETKAAYRKIISRLGSTAPEGAGVQGVIFGCTEIPLLIKPGDCPMPVFDTTAIHCKAGADFMLS
jgi:aspartate racemase